MMVVGFAMSMTCSTSVISDANEYGEPGDIASEGAGPTRSMYSTMTPGTTIPSKSTRRGFALFRDVQPVAEIERDGAAVERVFTVAGHLRELGAGPEVRRDVVQDAERPRTA